MALQTLRRMAARRHLRPDRRRLRALLGRRALDRPALREDALRQRAARARVPARVPGDRRAAVPSACARRRSTGRCASCARTRAASRRRWTPTPRASRASSTCGRLDEVRAALGAELADVAIAHFGVTEAGNFEGANILVRATPDPERARRDQGRGCSPRASSACGPALDDKRLTRLERADDLGARRRRRGARARRTTVDAAVACAEFVVRELRDADGRLLRTYNRGRAKLAGLPRGPRVPARGAADAVRGDVRRRAGSTRRARSPTRSSTASPTPSAAASSPPPTTTRR